MAIKRKFPPRVATVYCSGGCRAKKDEDGARTVCDVSCIACGPVREELSRRRHSY